MCMCYPRGRVNHHCSGTCTLHLSIPSSGWSASTFQFLFLYFKLCYKLHCCIIYNSSVTIVTQFKKPATSARAYYTICILILLRTSTLSNFRVGGSTVRSYRGHLVCVCVCVCGVLGCVCTNIRLLHRFTHSLSLLLH